MWRCFVKSFEIYWHRPFFRPRQICRQISRSAFWLPESALELSTGRARKAAADGPGTQLFRPETQQNNQTHVRALRYCV